jgi:antitoxin component YwqK of YwqJK toxin-antitoxin module
MIKNPNLPGILMICFAIQVTTLLHSQTEEIQRVQIDTIGRDTLRKSHFYPDGTLAGFRTIFHGMYHGSYAWYDSLGRIEGAGNYRFGLRYGISVVNDYANGIFCEAYHDTLRCKTTSTCRYDNGQVMSVSTTIDSTHRITGPYRQWHRNGKRALVTRMNQGKAKWTVYYDNGKVNRRGYILDEFYQQLGQWKFYRVDGSLERIEEYHPHDPNVKHGKWKYYDEKGKLQRIEVYNNDALVSHFEF